MSKSAKPRIRRSYKKQPKKLSRQRRWQQKMKKEGRCILCGKPRNLYAQHCDVCWGKVAKGKRWMRGGIGRPPKSAGKMPNLVVV